MERDEENFDKDLRVPPSTVKGEKKIDRSIKVDTLCICS